jgi:hypothetical protein
LVDYIIQDPTKGLGLLPVPINRDTQYQKYPNKIKRKINKSRKGMWLSPLPINRDTKHQKKPAEDKEK